MSKLYVVHWNAAEAAEWVAPIVKAKYEVLVHSETETSPTLGEFVPDAVVISLERLPSHGRAIAEWIWSAKKRQTIPIIFAGGAEDKVAATKKKLPEALYCEMADVLDVLAVLKAVKE